MSKIVKFFLHDGQECVKITIPLFGFFFLCYFSKLRKETSIKFRIRRCRDESKNHFGLQRVQTEKLQHDEEQEKRSGPSGDEQVLQVLQKAYPPQGNQIVRY